MEKGLPQYFLNSSIYRFPTNQIPETGSGMQHDFNNRKILQNSIVGNKNTVNGNNRLKYPIFWPWLWLVTQVFANMSLPGGVYFNELQTN